MAYHECFLKGINVKFLLSDHDDPFKRKIVVEKVSKGQYSTDPLIHGLKPFG
jgi:hypothetical protein